MRVANVAIRAPLLALMLTAAYPKDSAAQIHRLPAVDRRTAVASERLSISIVPQSPDDRLLEQLARPIDCNFQDATLAGVAAFVQAETGVPLYFDDRALEDAGLSRNSTISFRASRLPARSVLKLVLAQRDLTLVAKLGVLVITTDEEASRELETRVYPVEDLVAVQYDGMNSMDFDSLIDLITTTVAPTTWDEVGGPATTTAFPARSALVISQTAEVHEEIAGLIEVLRGLPHAFPEATPSGIRRLSPLQASIVQARAAVAGETQPNPAMPSWRMPRSHRE